MSKKQGFWSRLINGPQEEQPTRRTDLGTWEEIPHTQYSSPAAKERLRSEAKQHRVTSGSSRTTARGRDTSSDSGGWFLGGFGFGGGDGGGSCGGFDGGGGGGGGGDCGGG